MADPKYVTLASDESLAKAMDGLKARNFNSAVVDNKEQALAKIKEMIPAGASVMNGSSTTLHQIGYIEYLKSGQHGWNNLHETILNEKDPEKQSLLRKQSLASDFYLGSVHAMTESGEIVIASNSGSQLPNVTYGSQNLIFIVGTHKITPNLDAALDRLRNYVVGLEDQRLMKEMNAHTNLSKLFIFFKDPEYLGRKITVVFVKEVLGF
jgi:hypothetical protein